MGRIAGIIKRKGVLTMKKWVAILLAAVLVLTAVWVLWFGGFRVFGTLSELDDNGIHAFLMLNFISTDGLGSWEDSANLVRYWLEEFEKQPTIQFVYSARTPVEQVLSAALRYYYGLGPVTDYPPLIDVGWVPGGDIYGQVTDEIGVVRIYVQYHPGIAGDRYFPPVEDTITFKVAAEAGSLTLTRSGTVGEAMEYTVDNLEEVVWQDWDLEAQAPWEGQETFVTVTMYRNGVAEYRTRCRIYWTDSQEMMPTASGYTGEVVELTKLS